MIIALAGNQNCGKTTLFNALTGANQHVGNFPGVTVTRKSGIIKNTKDAEVVDLPGIYSMRCYSAEETVARDFLLEEKPAVILNVVDATNLERNLYLTLQLLELRIPTVLALNMMDEVRDNGGSVDAEGLSGYLGIPVVPISAARNEGIEELMRVVLETGKKGRKPDSRDLCLAGPAHRCIHSTAHLVEDHAEAAGLPSKYAAIGLIQQEPGVADKLKLSQNESETLEHLILQMEEEAGMDRFAALADMRYQFIESVCAATLVKGGEKKGQVRSEKIDKLLTNKYLALPLFGAIMVLIFWVTFNGPGAWLSGLLEGAVEAVAGWVDGALTAAEVSAPVHSLVVDGVIGGVGGVLSFIPFIVVLFFFLSVLEDTGYMARVAFFLDRPMRRIGLSGRSAVPLIIGFGCSVPAMLASRTMSSRRDRWMTLLLTPFMSCSAKIPIYALFSAVFFPDHAALVMIGLYLLGIAVGILSALLMRGTLFKGSSAPFVLELPDYRFPSARSVLLLMWEKAKDFLQRAFTVIFAASVLIWFLGAFDTRFNYVTDSGVSILAYLGKLLAPIFAPLGFGNWQSATALLAGFSAKEAVCSTFGVLLGSEEAISGLFTIPAALSFLTFTLLYTPCAAAVGTLKKELSSWVYTVLTVIWQCGVAWICAFVMYRIALLF